MRLKDIAKIGEKKDLQANLAKNSDRLRHIGKILHHRTDLGTGCRVYSAIAEATAAQLDLLGRLFDESIEITANICRTVFEINVVFRYCLLSRQHLEDFATRTATEEISIYKSIKKFADKDTDPTNLKILDAHIEKTRRLLERHGRPLKLNRLSTSQMAKDVGLEVEYKNLYGIYSKYIHASAWFVLSKRDRIDLPVFRYLMQWNSQIYAGDTLKRLEDIIKGSE